MSSLLFIALPVGLALAVGAAVALGLVVAHHPAPAPSQAAAAARRHGTRVAVAAWLVPGALVLLVGPVMVYLNPRLGSGVLTGLAPALLGLTYLAVHAVGERTWPRPAGPVRRAALVHRRVSDVAPGWIRWTVHGLAVATVAVLIACGATGATDGRSLERTWFDGETFTGATASPYPGWRYALPLLVAVALVALAAEGVLRLVAGRPAIVDADPAYDAASRRLSAHRALRGAALVIAVTLAGVLFLAGIALQGVELRPLGITAALLGVAVALGALAVTAIPAPAAVAAPPTPGVPAAGPPHAGPPYAGPSRVDPPADAPTTGSAPA